MSTYLSLYILKEINIDPLLKAYASLERVMQKEKDEFICDAAIHRFKYTYELSWKTIKRFLMRKGITVQGSKDVFRYAVREGIILNPVLWCSFLEAKNETSHAYNEDTAESIYKVIKIFIVEVERLIQVLQNLKES